MVPTATILLKRTCNTIKKSTSRTQTTVFSMLGIPKTAAENVGLNVSSCVVVFDTKTIPANSASQNLIVALSNE